MDRWKRAQALLWHHTWLGNRSQRVVVVAKSMATLLQEKQGIEFDLSLPTRIEYKNQSKTLHVLDGHP